MPFHLESLWGAIMPHKRVCDGLGQNRIVMVGKNSGLVLNRLWTKVHENLGQCRRHFVLSNGLAKYRLRYSLLLVVYIRLV